MAGRHRQVPERRSRRRSVPRRRVAVALAVGSAAAIGAAPVPHHSEVHPAVVSLVALRMRDDARASRSARRELPAPLPPPPAELLMLLPPKPRITPHPTPTPTPTKATPKPTPRHAAPARRHTVRALAVPTPKPSPTAAPTHAAVAPSSGRERVIAIAEQYIGVPYVWGGATPAGFDCSGLVQWAFHHAGYRMPRGTWDQDDMGVRTSISRLTRGDLVAWDGHIAIYLGGGRILEAPRTGLTVRERSLTGSGFDAGAWGVHLDYSRL